MKLSETAREQAVRMPSRWGLPNAPSVLDFAGGLSATLLDAKPGEVFSPASTAHIVSLVTKGERRHRMWHDGKLLTDGPLPAPSVNIVVSGVEPRAVITDPIKVLHVYVPAAQLVKTAECSEVARAHALQIVDPHYAPDPALLAILAAIESGLHGCGWTERLWLDSLGVALAARMIQRWSNLAARASSAGIARRGGLSPSQLRRVCDRLTDQLADEPRLEELAALAGLSSHHFCRAFAASTGLPPHRWLMRHRVEKASDLLRYSRLSIADIAARVGYDDPNYFARLFKRWTDKTPAAYRREQPF